MKKFLNIIKKNISIVIAFAIGLFISSGVAYAATIYFASSDVGYSNANSGLESDNVQGAIDELYNYCTKTEDASMLAMCPDCKYAFPTSYWYYRTSGTGPTQLSSSQYKNTWQEIVAQTGKDYFIGVKLDSSNKISRVYICGLIQSVRGTPKVPFCIEANLADAHGGASILRSNGYFINNVILAYVYGSNCTYVSNSSKTGYECTLNGIISKNYDNGATSIGPTSGVACFADNVGQIKCS